MISNGNASRHMVAASIEMRWDLPIKTWSLRETCTATSILSLFETAITKRHWFAAKNRPRSSARIFFIELKRRFFLRCLSWPEPVSSNQLKDTVYDIIRVECFKLMPYSHYENRSNVHFNGNEFNAIWLFFALDIRSKTNKAMFSFSSALK